MSENKFSIGHILGIGFSIFSLLVTLVQVCTPSKSSQRLSPEEQRAKLPSPKVPVINPAYFASLDEFHWQDSFPFRWEALTAAKIRYIELEGMGLPQGDDTVAANRNLGSGSGERLSIMTYFVKPEEQRLDHVYSKKLGNSSGQEFSADNVYFKQSRYSGYPEIRRSYSVQGADFEDNGTWILEDDGRPYRLKFDKGGEMKFFYESEAEICLNTLAANSTMSIRFLDSTMSASAMESKALELKRKVLTRELEDLDAFSLTCLRGSLTHPTLVIEIDKANQVQSVWENEYDSLQRPISRKRTDERSKEVSQSFNFEYDPETGDLLGWVHDRGSSILHVEFKYTEKGWPERMIRWIDNKNGTIRILSRTFFEFKQA